MTPKTITETNECARMKVICSASKTKNVAITQDSDALSSVDVSTKTQDRVDTIFEYISKQTAYRPKVGLICGSGLGGLSNCLKNVDTVPYDSIPEFPQSTVEGHIGDFVFGQLSTLSVVCLRGRFHTYEGYHIRETVLPVRVLYLLGVRYLIVTNAAGALHPDYHIGDFMILQDHLNLPGLAGLHPLVGPNDFRFGPRFTPLTECYDANLQQIALQTAEKLHLTDRIRQGVYCFVSGPTYETPTECKLLRLVGGDAVGMSTVPEVIVARHCGMHVLGLSLMTNKVNYLGSDGPAASHQEVLDAVRASQKEIEMYVREILLAIQIQLKE
uniref:Purine nucleoside phosphorylase n=1 Tax=Albugo laibachii Nc14 TaxID=890382 RepID=F0X2D4_9STRA|nr:purine nucleoside phosphorylase 1 putative [Albugo laibachii Nc14]|eukprot:CCA28020.1 purine nucleoside phosphorylase 1 putative [Albugo laibachii Nc14]